MGCLEKDVCQATKKNHRQINKICEPLFLEIGIDAFWHWTLTADGDLTFISSNPEISEYFYANELYRGHPYFRDPKHIPTGFILSDKISDKEYTKTQGVIKEQYSLDQLFMILNSNDKVVEGYGFGTTENLPDLTNTYLNNLFFLRKFIRHFHVEAKDVLKENDRKKVNIAEEIGEIFYQPSVHFKGMKKGEPNAIRQTLQLEALNSLSSREKDVLRWFLKGRSASQIGKVIHLSPRTVEFYLNNIKCKVGCQTKMELFDCLLEWNEYLNLTFF